MHLRRHHLAALTTAFALTLAACGGSDDASSSAGPATDDGPAAAAPAGAADELDAALAEAVPEGTVEIPSADGAVTIEEFAFGGTDIDLPDEHEITAILAFVGTDADGYIADDAVVVKTSEADAAVLCRVLATIDVERYRVVPVLPDGSGVDCS